MTSSSGTEDNLTEYERMSIVLEQKKSLLTERKKRYSELTTLQYNANQELIRMQKALKNQTANISAATKKYVDINVNLALADADCEYFKNNLTSHSVGFDQKEELADIDASRDHLKEKLNEYRDLKVKINEQRNNISTQNQSLRQECLNVGFYCKDMRVKIDMDIKKHIDRQNFDPNNGPKKHLRNTNKSAMTVANRVLDCREEVLGFFKQQVLKVKREERLAQEERDMLAEKQNSSIENSQAITENEVDSFVKKQKIFSDENISENADHLSDPSAVKPLQPKPPSKENPSAMLNLGANLMGRANLVGSTARQRRKERNSVFSSVNIDRIGEDLIRGCETEGNTSKLRALKQAMRHHVLYQLSFILMLENELSGEKEVCERIRKESWEESVLNSMLNGETPSSTSVEEEAQYPSRMGTAHANNRINNRKTADGQFGQNLGKLCRLSSSDITNAENFLSSGNLYVNSLSGDISRLESDLLATCTATEDMLYHTCIDGITEPWDPAILTGASNSTAHPDTEESRPQVPEVSHDCEEDPPSVAQNSRMSRGYRTQSQVLSDLCFVTSRGHDGGSEEKNGKIDKKNEKNFGLTKWLTIGNFEDKLSQILTNEVKAMNDIPIELGLAKLTSIGHTAKSVNIAHVQQQKERERQTMAIALSDICEDNPEHSLPQIAPPQEKKVYVAGLEKL